MKKLLCLLLTFAILATPVLSVTAVAPTYDVQITSTIVVDEVYRNYGDEPAIYWWASHGKFDAVVAGQAFQDITLDQLTQEIYNTYGSYCSYRADIYLQNENPWEVGQTYPVSIEFYTWSEEAQEEVLIFTIEAEAMACETQIASVSVKPVIMYVGQTDKQLHPVITYKDGSEEIPQEGYYRDWEFPTEVGTYEYTINFSAFVDVPVTITVLPVPTSGQCGENIYWTYDTASKTLTLTGTGEMYEIASSIDAFWAEDYTYEPPFWYCDAEHIVVGEGITKLPNFAFGELNQKTLQLPTTLQALPDYWLTVSTNMESLTIPEGITELTGWPFGSPGNSFTSLKELHLPSTLTTMDELTVLLSGMNNRNASVTLEQIYFAGTQEQWNAIDRVDSESIRAIFGEGNYENFYEGWVVPAKALVANIPVTFGGSGEPQPGTPLYGDATGDGVIDGMDVIRLKKYLANYNYETGESTIQIADSADATGDGIVDGMDVIRLKKYLANYNYETGESTIPLGPQ